MRSAEEGYIGKEMLSDLTDLERTCIVITQVVREGAFKLDEALNLYQIPLEAYLDFTAKSLAEELINEFSEVLIPDASDKYIVSLKLKFLQEVQNKLFGDYKIIVRDSERYFKRLESTLLRPF